MGATFEQPKHLNAVCSQRLIQAFRPVLVTFAVVLAGLVLVALWRKADAGEHISVLNWVLGASVGLWSAVLVRLALRWELNNLRYLECRDNGLFLARRGFVAFRRFVDWSITPDSVEPRYTRLRLTYKFGFGRKQWTMLLDDQAQISGLRRELEARIPRMNGS
jgi:hypothetical protein